MTKSQKNLLITILGVVGLTAAILFLVRCTIFVCSEIEEIAVQETVVEEATNFENWTMKDWYQNLPDEYKIENAISSQYANPDDFEYSEIVDEKNYYYQVHAKLKDEVQDARSGPELSNAYVTLTIFIAQDGTKTLAVHTEACPFVCGLLEDDIVFLQYIEGDWVNVQDDVVSDHPRSIFDSFFAAKISEQDFCDHLVNEIIILPRYGTKIPLIWDCPSNKEYQVADYMWQPKSGTFSIKKYY